MKKLLSILGAIGLVATTATTVVACSTSTANNPTVSYSKFKSWTDESAKNNQDMIIFIGGRTDSDSLSYLGAMQEFAQNDNNIALTHLTDAKHIEQVDNDFSAKQQANKGMTDAMGRSRWTDPSNEINSGIEQDSKLAKEILGNETPATTSHSLQMHSLLVDDLSNFWTNGLGTQIIKGFITDQSKTWLTNELKGTGKQPTLNGQPLTDKQMSTIISASVTKLTTALTGKGPFFLTIRNGYLVGISQGFKNYSNLNGNSALSNGDQLDANTAETDLTAFITASVDNIWANEVTWLENNWDKDATVSSNFILANATIVKNWTGKAGLNDTITKLPRGFDQTTPSSDSGNSNRTNNSSGTGSSKTTNAVIKQNYKFNESTIIKNS